MSAEYESLHPNGASRARPLSLFAVDRLVTGFVQPKRVVGRENLVDGMKLIPQGHELVLMPNHLSNADGLVLNDLLRKMGIDNAVYILGIKLEQEIVTNFLAHGVKYIPVWPPTIQPRNEKEITVAREMSVRGLRTARRLMGEGSPLVLFAEGGRSRTGGLREPVVAVEGYLSKKSVVVPVGIVGTRDVLPVGAKIPRRSGVTIIFGKPVLVAGLRAAYADLSKDEQRKAVIYDIMQKIADLLPQNYKGIFQSRKESAAIR